VKKAGRTLSVRTSSATDEQWAAVLRGSLPVLLWLCGLPVVGTAFWALHRKAASSGVPWVFDVPFMLGAGTLLLVWFLWRVTSSRSGIGRGHHMVNIIAILVWLWAVATFGWTWTLLSIWFAGGFIGCLAWWMRYLIHPSGAEAIFDQPRAKNKRRKIIDGGYVVRAVAARVPAVRTVAAKAAPVIPALNAPWEAKPAPAIEAPAATGETAKTAPAIDPYAVCTKFANNLASHGKNTDTDFNGVRVRWKRVEEWRATGELIGVPGVHTTKTFQGKRDDLASLSQTSLNRLLIRDHPTNHSRAVIDLIMQDTLTETPWWTPPVELYGKSVGEVAVTIGLYEDGEPELLMQPALFKNGTMVHPLSHIGVEGMPNAGKALSVDTPIPTPSGWATMGDLKPGDTVFDETGRPCAVTHAWDVRYGRPCYEIEFSDGSTIVADEDHQWEVETRASRIADANQAAKRRRRTGTGTPRPAARRTWPQVLTTGEMASSVRLPNGKRDRLNYSVRVAGALDCPVADLPVPPYTLGAWLGDGTSAEGSITSADPDVPAEIEREGAAVRMTPSTAGHTAPRYQVSGLRTRLRALGVLGNKHIPMIYLRASRDQRAALLAGLLDTDGSCTRQGVVEYYASNERLAREVRHLAASLGYKPTLRCKTARLNGRDCGPAWTVAFTPIGKVFRLPRKLARQGVTERAAARAQRRVITAIRPVPSVPVRCIAVDSPSRLFLAGETCIPTHNSTFARILVAADVAYRDVVDWGIDTRKGLQTMGPLAPAFDWFVTDLAEARKMVAFLVNLVIPWRASFLGNPNANAKGRVLDNWEPGCGLPFLRVVMEEAMAYANELGSLPDLANSARSAGVGLIISLQRGHSGVLDTTVRSALGGTMSYGCKDSGSAFLLENELADAGADPSQWKDRHPGKHYLQLGGLTLERMLTVARSLRVNPDVMGAWVSEHAPDRNARLEAAFPSWFTLLDRMDADPRYGRGVYAKRQTGPMMFDRLSATAPELPAVPPLEADTATPAIDMTETDNTAPGTSDPGADTNVVDLMTHAERKRRGSDPDDAPDPREGGDPDDEITSESIFALLDEGLMGDDGELSELDRRDLADAAAAIAAGDYDEQEDEVLAAHPDDLAIDLSDRNEHGRPPKIVAQQYVLLYLRHRGPGWEFTPGELYRHVGTKIIRSRPWISALCGGDFTTKGYLALVDKQTSRYRVTDKINEVESPKVRAVTESVPT
jgi:hypothetical protein